MKESGDHDEIVGEYNVNFGRENNPPSLEKHHSLIFKHQWNSGTPLIWQMECWEYQWCTLDAAESCTTWMVKALQLLGIFTLPETNVTPKNNDMSFLYGPFSGRYVSFREGIIRPPSHLSTPLLYPVVIDNSTDSLCQNFRMISVSHVFHLQCHQKYPFEKVNFFISVSRL